MIIVGFDGNFSGLALPTGKAIRLSAYARQCLRRLIVLGKQTFAEPMNLVYQDKLTLLPNAPVFALQAIRAGLEGVLFSLTESTKNSDLPKNEEAAENTTIGQIQKVLHDCVGERMTLQDIAEKLGYSVSYLKKFTSPARAKASCSRLSESRSNGQNNCSPKKNIPLPKQRNFSVTILCNTFPNSSKI